ncbi:MAG: cation:proton antiporter [Actinomycetia bacterium]|nr:cation:proton antiporter [Actinomycetes bacterium]
MTDTILVAIATIVVLGIGAQWVAKRLGIPPLLLLLPAGLLAGDVFGLVEPEEQLGDALFPITSALVALLLFQAGLSLRVSNLPKDARKPVARLVVVGGFITFAAAAGMVMLTLDVPSQVAWVMGAILVVSGPTVVTPLLKIVRPRPPIGPVLNWESTTLDPVGAVLGIAVLNVVIATDGEENAIWEMVIRMGLGLIVGLVAAAILILVLHYFLVTDDMEPSVALLFAVAAFTTAELLLTESGLVAAVVLGLVVANQRIVPTRRIDGFGETLDVIIVGTLFILLGALVSIESLIEYLWPIILIVLVLVLVVRPVAVLVSMAGSSLRWPERVMIGWVDPRGIVAAATAAQFSAVLASNNLDSSMMQPVIFGVIFGTGLIYGLTAKLMARRLQVAEPDPKGVAFMGTEPWILDLAKQLADRRVAVLLVHDHQPVPAPGSESAVGVPTLSLRDSGQSIRKRLGEAKLAWVVIATPATGAVQMATAVCVEQFGRSHVMMLAEKDVGWQSPVSVGIREYANGHTNAELTHWYAAGGRIVEMTTLEEQDTVPLVAIRPDNSVDLRPSRRNSGSYATILGLKRPSRSASSEQPGSH